MNANRLRAFGALALFGAFVPGCTGDDITYGPEDAAPKSDSGADSTIVDASVPDVVDASAPPTRLLTIAVGAKGELVAIDPSKKSIDGRLVFDGDGVTSAGFLLQTARDKVSLLDPAAPWTVKASWNVAGTDALDGGEAYADPIQVIPVAANKAYVLRYNRNQIAVIDPTQAADAGAATKYVDLSSLLQADDKDGHIDMSGAVFDPLRKRLYVALANVDLKRFLGFDLECPQTTSTLVAIDTTTDAIVGLGGSGPGGSVSLKGRSIQFGTQGGVVFDGVKDRIFVVTTGCAVKGDAGNVLVGRGIEAVDLKTNVSTLLLDGSQLDFPGAFAYESEHVAYVAFGFGAFGTTYHWDPAVPTLGPAFAKAPDTFAFDRKGAQLLGPQSTTAADGGTGPIMILSVPTSGDAGVTTIVTSPFLDPGFYLGNVTVVP
ncbi:hypothetical protein BH09MYX1_BH09MYX1_21820 [soil metagenome]